MILLFGGMCSEAGVRIAYFVVFYQHVGQPYVVDNDDDDEEQ